MAVVCLQRGHCFRKRGSTGTSGHRGSEQQFAVAAADSIAFWMRKAGHQVFILTADERVPPCDVFIALHQDGSVNRRMRGASIGYPRSSGPSYQFAQLWKAAYQIAGYPYGFRADNYTQALAGYYGFRMTNAPVRVIAEHGFATNVEDCNWMWDNLNKIGLAHANALQVYLGRPLVSDKPEPTQPDQDDEVTEMDLWAYINAAYAEAGSPGDNAGKRYWFKTAASKQGDARIVVLQQMEKLLGLK